MVRKTSTTAEATVAAPKKTEFKNAVKAFVAKKKKTTEEINAIISSVENVHAGVFKTVARLDAMDPAKRAEWLFHFDIAREFYDWLKAEPSLGLPDRPNPDQQASSDDDKDFRPGFLKQPGASAATVTELDPKRRSVKDAADAAESNLSKVGRGKTDPDPNTKH
jgi:hypothetical protein